MAVIKFAFLLSLAVLVLLPLCRTLEVPNYAGAEDWPELTVGRRRHQRIREEDRNGFNMRRLGGAIAETEPVPITEPEPVDEPKPVPGVKPNPVIPMPTPTPMPTPGSTASLAMGCRLFLGLVVCSSLLLGWLC